MGQRPEPRMQVVPEGALLAEALDARRSLCFLGVLPSPPVAMKALFEPELTEEPAEPELCA